MGTKVHTTTNQDIDTYNLSDTGDTEIGTTKDFSSQYEVGGDLIFSDKQALNNAFAVTNKALETVDSVAGRAQGDPGEGSRDQIKSIALVAGLGIVAFVFVTMIRKN